MKKSGYAAGGCVPSRRVSARAGRRVGYSGSQGRGHTYDEAMMHDPLTPDRAPVGGVLVYRALVR